LRYLCYIHFCDDGAKVCRGSSQAASCSQGVEQSSVSRWIEEV
jgi:hypothetical protein